MLLCFREKKNASCLRRFRDQENRDAVTVTVTVAQMHDDDLVTAGLERRDASSREAVVNNDESMTAAAAANPLLSLRRRFCVARGSLSLSLSRSRSLLSPRVSDCDCRSSSAAAADVV